MNLVQFLSFYREASESCYNKKHIRFVRSYGGEVKGLVITKSGR